MRTSERIALLALSAIVATSSAVMVLALDGLGVLPFSSVKQQASAPEANPPAAASAPSTSQKAAVRRPIVPHIDPPPPPMSVFSSSVIEQVDVATPEEEADEWRSSTTVLEPEIAPQRRLSPPRHERSDRLPWEQTAPSVAARRYTLVERVAEIAPNVNKRLEARFASAKASWPPSELALIAIKDQKSLELYARSHAGTWTYVHRYAVLAASGTSGPKLQHGDRQVPEGIYGISFLNPNSRYHVSLRVSYPNAFDREMAAKDGRTNLGGDIMIHGKAASVGCLAIGDEAAEELFVLAAAVGTHKIKVVIAPTDFRRGIVLASQARQPTWVPRLYTEIAAAMAEFKPPPRNILLSLFGQ